jgi:hypothetical protein
LVDQHAGRRRVAEADATLTQGLGQRQPHP